MPFTVSHVAAVLPGYRPLSRARVFSAAVIGSMVPDFGLLLPGSFARWQTHSLGGLFSFCLPVGLLTYWLTQLLIKPAVLEILPDGPYTRLRGAHPSASLASLQGWLYAAIAIVLGALTHLIWDGFTHEDGRGARMFPVLSDYGPDMAGHPLQLYRWLQYGSSVLGLVLLGAALALWLHHAPTPQTRPLRVMSRAERRLWSGLYLLLPLASLSWAILRPLSMGHWPFDSGVAIGGIAVAGMRATAVSLMLISAAIRLRLLDGNGAVG